MSGMRDGHPPGSAAGDVTAVPLQMDRAPAVPGDHSGRGVLRILLSEVVFLVPPHTVRPAQMGPLETAGIHTDGTVLRRRCGADRVLDILLFGTVLNRFEKNGAEREI